MKEGECYNCAVIGCTLAYRGIRCKNFKEISGVNTAKNTNGEVGDYKELARRLRRRYLDSLGNVVLQKPAGVYSDCNHASTAITDLLARAEAAEARCETLEKMVKEYQEVIIPGYREQAEKAERERDAAVSDLTFAVNQYRLFTTDIDLCGLCKFDLPPAGENGQTHECLGFYKDNCFEWRG